MQVPLKSQLTSPATAPLIPDYELIQLIGVGAYGEVWLARSSATGVFRAVKIVRREAFAEERPFNREFEGMSNFESISRSHPSQMALFHVGRNDSAGYFFYVMELADLATESNVNSCEELHRFPRRKPSCEKNERRFADHALSGQRSSINAEFQAGCYFPRTLRSDLERGRLPVAQVLDIGIALAEALQHLHSNGLVHRDVKPSNIVYISGRPKLADIGLVTDPSDKHSIVGTEGYLPREGPGTPQADLFALGKVLYEAATGLDRRKFPQLPPNLRSWTDSTQMFELNEIILRACASACNERYASAAALQADLLLLRDGSSVRQQRIVQHMLRRAKRGVVLALMLGLMFAGALLMTRGGYGIRQQRSEGALAMPGLSLRNRASPNPEADMEYWKGWDCYRPDTPHGVRNGWKHFTRALELDPECVAAQVGLFEVYLNFGDLDMSTERGFANLRAAARRLMEMDAKVAEAHSAKAFVDYYLDWSWEGAERSFKTALELNPDSAIAQMRYGFFLTHSGQPEKGLLHLRRADWLDPIHPRIKKNLGHPYLVMGRFLEAIAEYQKALELQPSYPIPHRFIGEALLNLGKYEEALDKFVEYEILAGGERAQVEARYDELREAFRVNGSEGYWRTILNRLQAGGNKGAQYQLASCYARLGMKPQALDALELAFAQREPFSHEKVFWDFAWEPYRKGERFQQLLRSIGVPP